MSEIIDLTSHFERTREGDELQRRMENLSLIDRMTPKAKADRTTALLRQVVGASQVVLSEPLDQFNADNLRHLLEQAEDHLLALGED